MATPIYLFTGFLEAGKTSFIQEVLEDKRFNSGEKTLLLLCEEGEEEYDPTRFAGKNVYIEPIDDVSQLTDANLKALRKKHNAERVIIEYNGMWMLDDLYAALPEDWSVYQEFMTADGRTFINYNANMRSLVVDKLKSCEMVVFNRMTEDISREEIHKIVRGVSRRAGIAYETLDGDVQYDEIEDPLPFDIEAPIVEIEDKDYAWWYRDLAEEPDKYEDKTVRFKGMVAKNAKLPKNTFVPGRMMMTCCAEDTSFVGFICRWDKCNQLKSRQWVTVTAVVNTMYHAAYKGKGPVLTAISVEPAHPPEEEVAAFY